MHEKLYKLRDAAMQELEGMGDRLDRGSVEVAKNLASLICKLDCITDQGYSRDYSRRYSREDGYSNRRDSMGRYARDDGYSYGSAVDRLRELVDSQGIDLDTKNDLHRILTRMEQQKGMR
jgi:hypothetical protein|nr:MAG TPA: hypothetical protein [Caudoviricetes sp.]